VAEVGEDCIMRSFIPFTLHQIFVRIIESRRMRYGGSCSTHGRMRSVYKILVGNLKGIDHLEVTDVDGKMLEWK
jgi:hypothetical protein